MQNFFGRYKKYADMPEARMLYPFLKCYDDMLLQKKNWIHLALISMMYIRVNKKKYISSCSSSSSAAVGKNLVLERRKKKKIIQKRRRMIYYYDGDTVY